jgi:hypothetical protein
VDNSILNSGLENPFAIVNKNQPEDLNKVNGLEGAKAFPTKKDSRYALFDGNRDILFVKSTDSTNCASYQIFKLSEISEEDFIKEESPYATKQDVEDIKEMVKDVKQLVSKFTNTNTNTTNGSKRQEYNKQTQNG